MSTGLQFDEDAARRVEGMYMTPDVVAQRQAILQALSLRPGERVVDVGAGRVPGVPDGSAVGRQALSTGSISARFGDGPAAVP
jgi:hypothetical protein